MLRRARTMPKGFSAKMTRVEMVDGPISRIPMTDQISLQPVFSWTAVAVIAAGLVALMLIRPDFVQLSPARMRTLLLLRSGVIALAILAMLRPGCVSTVDSKQSAQLRMLLDLSRSLELPHESDTSRRWDVMRRMIDDNSAVIAQLAADDIEIVWEGFDGQVKPLEVVDGMPQLPDDPDGAETDLAQAIYTTARGSRDKRVVGVIIPTDGVQNSAEMPVDVNDAIAALEDRGIPLYPVPLGLPAGVGETADVAVTNLPDHHTVAVKNRLAVRAALETRGYANQRLTVQLAVSRAGQTEEIVDTRFVTPASGNEQQVVELYVIPPEPGQFRMAVRVLPMPGEIALRNNELTSFLSVEEGGMRVLMLMGGLNAEQIYLRKAIPAAAQGIDLDFFSLHPDTQALGGALTELLRDETWDVIVLMDLDARAIYEKGTREENVAALEQHVARGKGLLMIGGDHSFGPGLWHSSPLADVLPVTMDPRERQDFGTEINRSLHIERQLKLVPVENHFLTRLDDASEPRESWKKLPPLLCANRFAGIKDSAEVLLESETGEPIMVAGGYGAGRVIAFAGDSTWRWWLKGYQDEYKAFWRQILYWLAFRDGQSNDLVRIEMPRRRFSPESAVTFSADAWTATGERIADSEFESWMVSPDGKRTNIQLTRSGDRNWAELGRDLVTVPGIYTVGVRAHRGGEEIGQAEREFSISDSDREKSDPAANHELLERLAAQTGEFGGRVVSPVQFGELLASLKENLPELQVKVPVKWQLGQTAADSSVFLLAFVGLLGTEWFLRKRWGLV